MNDEYLSPAETAKRLGISAKALRLYEHHGLVAPLRTHNGWRTYGPEHLARLHQILALKRLGLPLSRIGELLRGRPASLDDLLAVQERLLAQEQDRLSRAMSLVRAARTKLAAGEALSVTDLVTLTTETTMTTKPSDEELKAIFEPLIDRHFTAEDRAGLAERPYDQAAVTKAWDVLIAEAKTLMAKGDPGSPEALDLARRWKAQVEAFTGGDPAVTKKVAAVWKDAMADPATAPKLPLNPEIMGFMGQAMAKLGAASPG